MSETGFSANDIEATIAAHRPNEVSNQLNFDFRNCSAQEFSDIVHQMESRGKVKVESGSDGSIDKVTLKDGIMNLEFDSLFGSTVFNRSYYPKEDGSNSNLAQRVYGWASAASGGMQQAPAKPENQ